MKTWTLPLLFLVVVACTNQPKNTQTTTNNNHKDTIEFGPINFQNLPNDEYGELVKYGYELMTNTAYYIGPKGKNGQITQSNMSCSNCHQLAGTKSFSFSLVKSHENYPQFRPRENKILTLTDRVNNCVTRPLNGIDLKAESREMLAFLCYLKWLNNSFPEDKILRGEKNLSVKFMDRAASSQKGQVLYQQHCERCHQANGEGLMNSTQNAYVYPPLWGSKSYQAGSSMHRVIKQAQWLKANMPYDSATWQKPVLTDEEALDIAAFVNDDNLHHRKMPENPDYPNKFRKAIDHSVGPYADPFSEQQHKFGPYQPIIDYWNKNNMKPIY
jgi:thiosulfate dehydrogenase